MARHSEETKAAAMSALLEGQSVSAVAREYEIPKGTVSHWKRTAVEGAGGPRTENRACARGGGEIGDLLMDLLEQNIRSLVAISKLTADSEWLSKQSAAEIATLFGVKHDKAIRMIEALNQSESDA